MLNFGNFDHFIQKIKFQSFMTENEKKVILKKYVLKLLKNEKFSSIVEVTQKMRLICCG